MKVTTATRRSFKRKTVYGSLFKVICYVVTCFMSEKGTTSVDLRVDCKLDSDSSRGIYSSCSGSYTSGIYNRLRTAKLYYWHLH